MLQARSGNLGSFALLGNALRLLILAVVFLASPFPSSAKGQGPSTVGSWSQFMDWICDASSNCSDGQLQHGALIPHGPYRGSVLMWRACFNGATIFLWRPDNPIRLYKIPSNALPFGQDVAGISMTWDDEGQLVVVGSSVASGSIGDATWRFFPAALNYPPMETEPVGLPCTSWNAQVDGTPWRDVGKMSVARFLPTLITLCTGTIFGGVASDSTFVLGGTTSNSVNDGLEFWQALSPRSTIPGGSAWSQTFISKFNPPPHAPPPTAIEQYDHRGGLTQAPQVQHETTPAALQLADAGTGASLFRNAIFVAHDTNVVYSSTPPAGDPSGVSWFVRPRYETAPGTWEIWDGPAALQDRNQGTAVLRHDLAGHPGTSGKNRVISIGGVTFNVNNNGWEANGTISEYAIPTGGDPTTGTWSNLAIPGVTHVGRVDNSAVVLPTGDILVVGGGIFTGSLPAPVPGTPQHTPQLVRPGLAGSLGSTWSVTDMAPSATIPGFGQMPRMRGHAAVLLPDGRVLVAGGSGTNPTYAFNGQIFLPPYLFQGFRPMLMTEPTAELEFESGFKVHVGRGSDEIIDAVVLVRPASTVFGFDTSQRYIELEHAFHSYDQTIGIETRTVIAPRHDLGPAGYYMLFVVSHLASDPNVRVPSVAQFVRLKP